MTCNNKCIHYPVCEQKKFELANIEECPYFEEISQGEWIVDENDDLFNSKKCSNCGEVAEWLDGGSQFLSNYCPNCGACMQKGGAE